MRVLLLFFQLFFIQHVPEIVVGQDAQKHFASLTMIVSGLQGCSQRNHHFSADMDDLMAPKSHCAHRVVSLVVQPVAEDGFSFFIVKSLDKCYT